MWGGYFRWPTRMVFWSLERQSWASACLLEHERNTWFTSLISNELKTTQTINTIKPQDNYTDPDLKYTASNKQTCRQRYQYKATTIPSLSPHLSCKVASVQKKKWAKKTFRSGAKKKIYFIPHGKRTAKHSCSVMEVEKLLGIIKQRNPSWRNCPPQGGYLRKSVLRYLFN